MKSLGGTSKGARLERIKSSPRWAGERFHNVHPVMPGLRDPNAAMPTIDRDFRNELHPVLLSGVDA